MRSVSNYYTYPMPYGPLTIQASSRGIERIELGEVALAGKHEPSALTNKAATQLQEYFAGRRKGFDVRLDLNASAFQKAVWQELMSTEYATTCTCEDIAAALGKPGAHRSVGTAIKHNPLAIIIPDHRIVTAAGKTPGTGKEASLKHALLLLEQRYA